MRNIASCLLTLSLASFCPGTLAQVDEIETGFAQFSPGEEQRLRAILAEPVPQGALFLTLRRHFRAKDEAAYRLGDVAAREAILREQVRLVPDDIALLNLGGVLLGRGEIEEGNAYLKEAIDKASSLDQKALSTAVMAYQMYLQFRDATARTLIIDVSRMIDDLAKLGQSTHRRMIMSRCGALIAWTQSLLEERSGRFLSALAAAVDAEQHARRAMSLASGFVGGETHQAYIAFDIAMALSRRIETEIALGRLHSAERTIADYLRLSKELKFHQGYRSHIYRLASGLRFAQREFAQAEALMRKSSELIVAVVRVELGATRTDRVRRLAITLWAQKRWGEALAEFEQLDASAGADERLQERARYGFERGLVYLANQKYQEAAELFRGEVSKNADAYGPNHFMTAQATGLLGAALRRTNITDKRTLAVALLRGAVADYMTPANAEYLENVGIRKEVRELIFAAYLEAIASTPGEDPTLALGPADWVRGGIVQDALADAAARSAATTPALADLVRQDQDAKNEMTGLRKYLAGEVGAVTSVLPVVASKMRARIAELETTRERLRALIKQGFPDYDQLVRPSPANAADIARNLGPGEALLLLVPTESAVYAWAVAADRPAGFARVALPENEVDGLVKRLRSGLDFAQFAGRPREFDSAASHDLYRLLLAPLDATLAGKTQLVVAAGGALGQLPFGVLFTKPHVGIGDDAPWLIKQAGITHIPSIGAWLAVRRFSVSPRATEALMGWADPKFRRETTLAVAGEAARIRAVLLTRAATAVDLEKESPRSALRYADIPALPETRDELLAVAGVLKANVGTDLRLGAGATRQSVLDANRTGELGRKRVVFFATHGLMAGDLPELNQPALALAATGQELQDPLASLLKLDDVLSLKLNADWVVLSACNTAAADGRAGEALSGLARGFFYAGSRSLLVTHWSVESESAKLLTTSTFEYHGANPEASKAESLRQAMLKVMKQPQFAHPAFWAPYALVGDGAR